MSHTHTYEEAVAKNDVCCTIHTVQRAALSAQYLVVFKTATSIPQGDYTI